MIILKKYTNRKLYSNNFKKYFNFDDVKVLLIQGTPFKVEHEGKDITKEVVQKVHLKYGLPKEIIIEYI